MRVNVNFKYALMLSTICLVALSLSVSKYFSFQELKKTTIESAKTSISSNIDNQADLISEFLNEKIAAVDKLAELKRNGEINNDLLLSKVSLDAMNATFFGVGYNDGSAVGTFDNYVAPEGYDVRTRPWFQAAKKTDKAMFTDVYQEYLSGKNTISVAKDFGEGVILADLSLDFLNGAVKSLAVNTSISGVVITEEGVALASTSSGFKVGDKMDDFRGLKDMFSRFKGHDSIFLEYIFDGNEKYAAVRRIKVGDKSWYIMSGISGADLFKEVKASGQRAIISTLVAIGISVVVMLFLLKAVYTPILQLRETLRELSSGEADFTQRLTVLNEKDDLGKITHYVNNLIENSQNMMKQISSVSESLGHVITDIRASSSNNSAILADHVAQTELVVTAIEEMNVTSRAVAQNAADAASETQSANQVGMESRSVVEQAKNSVISLVEEVQTAADRVENMSQETQNISSITDVIGGIAEQTNLLALNAAIEAARAGEQGRGFAVVADEVRALAARTQTSTSEIDDAVSSLTNGSAEVVHVMDETKNACHLTAEQTSMVSNSLDELSTAIEKINEITEQIATAAKEQTSVSEEISQSMTEISEIANTVNSNVSSMTSSAEAMAEMYDQLNGIVGNSKI